MSRHADAERELEDARAFLRRARRTVGLAPAARHAPLTYQQAHRLVRERRGPASQLPCAHCDGWAAEWAYDHRADPDPLVDARGRRYSADPERRYLPLCRRCHRRFDHPDSGSSP